MDKNYTTFIGSRSLVGDLFILHEVEGDSRLISHEDGGEPGHHSLESGMNDI